MNRVFCAVACLLAWVITAQAAPLQLARGVGVHEWLNWSPLAADGSYRWPPYRSEEEWLGGSRPRTDWPAGNEFRRIRSMGFDFVRLSVDPGPLLANEGARRRQALQVLHAAVGKITSAGLKVVFDLHGVTQVPAYGMEMIYGGADSDGVARYRKMVVAVATMLAKIGTDKVALEPYNEPAYYPCDASGTNDWQRIMAATVADIRAVSADLTIIVTGACGGSITGLTNLDPDFDDPNLYYNFHMYEPHSFTHQRADDPQGFSSGLPWPADSGTPEAVVANLRAHMAAAGLDDMDQALNLATMRVAIDKYFAEHWGLPQMQARIGEATGWAKAHHIPTRRLFMGEFGAMLMSADGRTGAFDADRLRYLTALRQEAERLGIVWSIWEYSNPYGMSVILPKGPAVPDAEMLQALGLR
jgi:hypothetical protein